MSWLSWLLPFPILPWPPALWTKRDVAEFVSFAATIITAAASFCATQVDEKHKWIALVAAAGCSVIALYGKAAAGRLEKLDKERKELDTKARAVKIADALLESIHRGHFREEGEEDADENRITIFTCVEPTGCSGQKKRLAIFARCGVHRSSTTSWIIDDETPEGCRGAAGKAWFHSTTVIKRADAAWPGDGGLVGDKDKYAAGLGITVAEAESLKVKSRAIAAAPILVRGAKWGVLVLDSVSGEAIPPANSDQLKEFKARFNHYAELVGRTLGEAGL